MSGDSVEPLCSDIDVTAYNLPDNRVNKQTDLGNIGVSSTVSAFPVKSGDLAEVTRPQSVCFSDLQYCDVTLQGHAGVFSALKDIGAEVSLIKNDLVEGLDLPYVGSVMIRGIWGSRCK